LSKVPILFLVGSGRSGTTLLSRLLDGEAGLLAVGETRYLGEARRWTESCGCGRPHAECPLWGPLIADWSEPGRLAAWQAAAIAGQADQLAAWIAPRKPLPALRGGLPVLRDVYERLASRGDVVVDESKTPWLGYLLAEQPWADVRFVELVRDPRDVVTSWQQAKSYLDYTPREVAAQHWLRTCVTAEMIRKRTGNPWLRLPFAELANDPSTALTRVLRRAPEGLQHTEGSWSFDARSNHIYLSNPDKLRRGVETIRPTATRPAAILEQQGRWERLALRYWDRWLVSRTYVTKRWPV
jgi:hypothetical protein